ncbi:MAG: hypothetical protein ACLQDV_18345 [Candidatus Binataceae bacterium]
MGADTAAAQASNPTISAKDEAALAEEEYDPTASLTQVQTKDIFTPARYGTNAQPNALQIRPLLAIPSFSFIPLDQLIRPTFRIVTAPTGKGASTSSGYDDMQLLDLFVAPWPNFRETGFRWAVGPYFVFPTSTIRVSGDGAWQMGPAAAFGYRGIPGLQIAGLFQQATSFGYTSSQSKPVTSIMFQPIITYKLGKGWYVKSSDATWTFNLRHNTSTRMPLSAGFGKVWKISEGFAIDTSASGEWMAYRQFAPQSDQFTLNFQLTVLFPTLRL